MLLVQIGAYETPSILFYFDFAWCRLSISTCIVSERLALGA